MSENREQELPTSVASQEADLPLPPVVTEHAESVADTMRLAFFVLGLLVATGVLALLLALVWTRDARPLYVLGG